MMMRRPALAFGLCVLASACSHSPPTRFYVLAPSTPSAPHIEAYAGAPVWIAAVKFPPEFDRPELVNIRGSDELTVDDFAHWAAPIGDLARTTLTEDLVDRLAPGQVVDGDASAVPHRDIVVKILALRRTGNITVLNLSWTLSPVRPTLVLSGASKVPGAATQPDVSAGENPLASAVLQSSEHTARLSERADSAGPKGQADVLGRLLGRTADQIALSLAGSN